MTLRQPTNKTDSRFYVISITRSTPRINTYKLPLSHVGFRKLLILMLREWLITSLWWWISFMVSERINITTGIYTRSNKNTHSLNMYPDIFIISILFKNTKDLTLDKIIRAMVLSEKALNFPKKIRTWTHKKSLILILGKCLGRNYKNHYKNKNYYLKISQD